MPRIVFILLVCFVLVSLCAQGDSAGIENLPLIGDLVGGLTGVLGVSGDEGKQNLSSRFFCILISFSLFKPVRVLPNDLEAKPAGGIDLF